jgi:Fur family transcriptional regulator, ferric uptake regulator
VVEFVEATIEARQEAIARRHGFAIEDHSLVIYGICPDCRAARTEGGQVAGEAAGD